MESSIIVMMTTTLVALSSGISSFFIPFVGDIPALMQYMPSVVSNVISAGNFAWANGCCICIPIPLVFGALVLRRRRNASTLAGTLSEPDADS